MNTMISPDAMPLGLSGDALDILMPMHLALAADGRVIRTGPTLKKFFQTDPCKGDTLADLFELRRPTLKTGLSGLSGHIGKPIVLAMRDNPKLRMRGVVLPCVDARAECLVNLTPGVHLGEAVRRYNLTMSDFAPTDLAIELLYLIEARGLAMGEAKKLIRRLDNARIIAQTESTTDSLTGLPNRRGLNRYIASADKLDAGMALVLIDLDLFKTVNDTHGHAAGDAVLTAVAKRLQQQTRATDFVARAGGDEFILLLHGLTDASALESVANRVVRAVSAPVEFEGNACFIGACAGAVLRPAGENLAFTSLLRTADKALYAAKAEGSGRVVVAGALPG